MDSNDRIGDRVYHAQDLLKVGTDNINSARKGTN
jgi:hypothetical protein